MENLKIVFSRGFLHWTWVMGHGDESGAVLTCIRVDYRRYNLKITRFFFAVLFESTDERSGR